MRVGVKKGDWQLKNHTRSVDMGSVTDTVDVRTMRTIGPPIGNTLILRGFFLKKFSVPCN